MPYENHSDDHLKNLLRFHEDKARHHVTSGHEVVAEIERRQSCCHPSMLEHRVRTLEGRIASMERKTAKRAKK